MVEEVMERTATGVTQPFVCRLSDDHAYIVKGQGATRRGLVSELVAGLLAQEVGLPIPPFVLADVRSPLLRTNAEARSSLGAGLAFGSRQLFDVVEVDRGMLDNHVPDLLRALFLFDYWIANGDRTGSVWAAIPTC